MIALAAFPLLTRIFAGVWTLSWQAALLGLMVLLAQFLSRRWLTASWRYNLWLLVVARLLLPFSAASHLSIFNVVRYDVKPAARSAATIPPPPVATRPLAPPAPASASPDAPARASSSVDAAALPPERPAPVSSPAHAATVPAARLLVTPVPAFDPWAVAACLWLAGTAAFVVYTAATTWRFLRQVRRATLSEDPQVTALLDQCRRQINVRSPVALCETPLVKSPALFGVFRPRLLLPPGLTQRFSPAELRYVFLHELAHVRRRDVAMNWLLTLLQAVHWFNPLLWFGFARLRADRELACDALALACSSEAEAKTYGLTIVKLLEGFARPSASPGLVGILESKHQMTRRIRLIATFRRRRRWSWLAAGLMAALAATGLTDAVRSSHAQEEHRPPTPKAGEKTLRLTVLDAQTGQPIRNAEIVPGYGEGTTYSEKPPTFRTDANGVYVFPIDPASYGFNCGVFSDGYAPRTLSLWYSSNPPKPEVPPEHTVRLERGGSIGGVLRDAAGQPVAGVRVMVRGVITERPQLDVTTPRLVEFPCCDPLFCPGVVTDAQGRWSCANFAAGQGMQIDFERSDGAFARFHSPQPKFFTGLGGQTIDPAPAWHGELVCVFPPGTDVRGTVVDPAGHPLAGITVRETDGRHRIGPVSTSITAADGRFVLPGRDPHQLLLTLTGPGFAPRLEVVNVAPGLADLSLPMHPATPLRLRVVDTDGKPVPGTVVLSSEPTLPWQGTCDAEGRASWDQAPIEPAAYSVEAKDYGPRVLSLAATGAEQTITLRRGDPPGVLVTVRATDESGKPLRAFSVAAACQTNGGMSEVYDRDVPLGAARGETATVLVSTEASQSMDFRLKVEAPGHAPFTSEPMSASPHDADLTAILRPAPTQTADAPGGDHARVTLRLPGGQPAAGASVVVNDSSSGHNSYISLTFFGGHKPQAEGEHKKTVVADAAGNVALPTGGADTPAFVLHDDAYLFTTLGELRRAAETTLRAWGRVEGAFTLNGQPRAEQRLNLQPHYGNVLRLSFLLSASTDRSGKFVFDRVPADDYTLACTEVNAGQWPQNHTIIVHVDAGETTRLAYEVTGRTITGQVRLDPPDAEIDWKKDVGDCLLTALPPKEADLATSQRPAYDDFVRYEDFKRVDEAFLHAHRFAESAERQDTYAPTVDANGGLRFEGVTPGVYEFRLELRKSSLVNHQWQNQPLGSIRQTVVVTAPRLEHADAPQDLGTLALTVDASVVPRRPAVALGARTLEGQAINLAGYRGKPVLLLFWASWAPPTPRQLDDWQAAARDPRLAVLGLSLDDDPAAARQFARGHALPGTQARLEGSAKAAVTEALAIDDLPAAVLVGPDGRVAARDLSGPRLRAAADSVLAAHP